MGLSPHRHSPELSTPELCLPWDFSRCAHPRHGCVHTHRAMHPPKCTCAHASAHITITCAHVQIPAGTSRNMYIHLHTQAWAHPAETPARMCKNTDTCTEEGGHSWHSPSSAVGSGPWLQPRVPVPLACTPGTNSRATVALIPDFRPFSCSPPRIRSDSRRQGHGMWLLLM